MSDFLDPTFSQFKEADQKALAKLLKLTTKSNPLMVEIGCWTGRSTSVIAKYCKRHKGRLYVVDHFKGSGDTSLMYIARVVDIKQVFQLNMDRLKLSSVIELYAASSKKAALRFPANHFDFIFIDADHRYKSTKENIHLWYPKLIEGGIIAGHDFDDFEYDEKFIHHDFMKGKHHGVIKAVIDFFPEVKKSSNLWWHQKPRVKIKRTIKKRK